MKRDSRDTKNKFNLLPKYSEGGLGGIACQKSHSRHMRGINLWGPETPVHNHKLRYKLITSTCYDFPIKVKWTLSDRGPVKGVITDTRYRSTATTTVLVSTLQRVLCGEGGRAGVALWWHKPMAQSVTPRRFIEHRIPRLLPRLLLGQTIDHQILKCRLFH